MSNVDFAGIEPRLSDGTLAALKSFGFSKMTPVQAATIPLFLTNKVVVS
jgi:superfamily II DNA/RNA helicase